MQKIFTLDNRGKKRELIVVRSFTRNCGAATLHELPDGSYGYAGGDKVKSESEIDFLPEPHKTKALNWLKAERGEICNTEKKASDDLIKMDKKSLAALAGLDDNAMAKVKKSDIIAMIRGEDGDDSMPELR